jgi:hypothetical protein
MPVDGRGDLFALSPAIQAADFDSDCKINGFDLVLLLGAWGAG